MFIKDNAFDMQQKQRIETRVAAPRTLVQSGFTPSQLTHVKEEIMKRFPKESSQPIFKA